MVKIASFDVITNKKWYHLVDQTQGYLINVNLFRYALKERKPRVVLYPPHSGAMSYLLPQRVFFINFIRLNYHKITNNYAKKQTNKQTNKQTKQNK